ncbi:Lrp/AsnC family transcriptional regulator [uncultured Pseudokineococcus sp.]|uniref:Lrp/AsnC family transcriptional regulator n=1 Tax=uncultured Pseudokineococcus sp. TaxID=1642928 RepID=UPI002621C850|nr:Lrp/AsnC ligand binding domain-containing protein [uncultured Pseudokineococcus sp.]
MSTAALLDEADLDLVAALQVSPRASLATLGEVLSTSPSTVGRRIDRLLGRQLLRVVGQVDWSLLSDSHPHHVWVTTAPGAAREVAERLAELPEAQFTAVTTGRADVHLTVQARTRRGAGVLLTETVPRTPGVVATHTELVLRATSKADRWRLDRLTQEQVRALEAEVVPPGAPGAPHTWRLSDLEGAAVRLLHVDGRASAAEMSRALSVSRSTAHRVVTSLLSRGAVAPRVEVEPSVVGFALEVIVALQVRPGSTAEVSDHLARHRSARYVSVVAGSSSVIHQGAFTGAEDLAAFLEEDLAALPGVDGVGVSVVVDVLQRYWVRRTDGRITGVTRALDWLAG